MRVHPVPRDRSSAAAARTLAIGAAILCSSWPGEAQAYLDPLTGSVIIQALIGSVLGALFAVKVYWRKIKAYFTGRPVEGTESAPEGTLDEDER